MITAVENKLIIGTLIGVVAFYVILGQIQQSQTKEIEKS